MSYILQIDNLSKYFGGLAAVSNCSLKIKEGSITGIIGPNGSGKTTLFNLIAGNLKSSEGKVLFKNENITDVPSHELFSKGLLRTFISVFAGSSIHHSAGTLRVISARFVSCQNKLC